MEKPNLERMRTFGIKDMPDLDTAVLGALELLMDSELPEIDHSKYTNPIVVGSGNALEAGSLIFQDWHCDFATNYPQLMYHLEREESPIDGAFVFSASGGKDSVKLTETLKEQGIHTTLLTCNENYKASADDVLIFPKNREPYTYNVSTYLGMLLSGNPYGEDAGEILKFIKQELDPALPTNFGCYSKYFLLGLEDEVRRMALTKFDELLQPHVTARGYSYSEILHAKTVNESVEEMYVNFGNEKQEFGILREHIPLPDFSGPVAEMAISYYVIGKIQAAHEPYFKKNIVDYCKKASRMFGQEIKPIVE